MLIKIKVLNWLRLDLWNNFCVRNTPPKIGPNRSFSVLWKHNALQINTFIFSKNLHNPEVPGSNPGLATWKSRTYVKSWVLFCVRKTHFLSWNTCYHWVLMREVFEFSSLTSVFNNILFKLENLFFHFFNFFHLLF